MTLNRALCSLGTCYCTSHLPLEPSQVPHYYPPCPYPGVRCILGQWLCQCVYVFPRASDSHIAVRATSVGSAVPAGAQHAARRGQVRVACGQRGTSQGWAEPRPSGPLPAHGGIGEVGDRVPVSVRRTLVMVLRTSASLSVSMYSDSLPAMKPQRTCPSLAGKRST